jgi:hypothetical protein
MKGCLVYDKTSLSVLAYLTKFYPIIRALLNTFIAYNLEVFLSLTKYTSPKLPLPSSLIGIKLAGPIFSSSVADE